MEGFQELSSQLETRIPGTARIRKGDKMKNSFNREVFEYWTSLLNGRSAPSRSEVDPSRIRAQLSYTFILEIDTLGEEAFRLAGTNLCATYRRELKGSLFSTIWQPGEYDAVRDVFSSMKSEYSSAVITSEIRNSEDPLHRFHPVKTAEVETILLPLTDKNGIVCRCLGCQVPRDVPYWIGHKEVLPHGISKIEAIGSQSVTGFPGYAGGSAADGRVVQFGRRARIPNGVPGRQVGHLTVIDCEGLRTESPSASS